MPPRRKKQTQEDDSLVALQLEQLRIEAAKLQYEEAAREREEAARVRQHELQLAQLQMQARQAQQNPQCHWKVEAFPTFDEDKDSIETFLEGFELELHDFIDTYSYRDSKEHSYRDSKEH
jgi:hypothetical protein